jgi:hypothetical protein
MKKRTKIRNERRVFTPLVLLLITVSLLGCQNPIGGGDFIYLKRESSLFDDMVYMLRVPVESGRSFLGL